MKLLLEYGIGAHMPHLCYINFGLGLGFPRLRVRRTGSHHTWSGQGTDRPKAAICGTIVLEKVSVGC